MPAALSRLLGAAFKPTISLYDCRDIVFGPSRRPGPLLWMTSVASCFCLQISSVVRRFGPDSVRNLIGCRGDAPAGRRIPLLSEFSLNDWSRTREIVPQYGRFSSNLLSLGLRNRCEGYSSEVVWNSWGLPGLESVNRPDMFSLFSSKVTEVSESGAEDQDNRNDEAEVYRLKKEEEQRKRGEDAEKLRKEREIEDKIGPPPEKPLPGDCCGNGCSPCVWDTYWDELADYKLRRKSVESSE